MIRFRITLNESHAKPGAALMWIKRRGSREQFSPAGAWPG